MSHWNGNKTDVVHPLLNLYNLVGEIDNKQVSYILIGLWEAGFCWFGVREDLWLQHRKEIRRDWEWKWGDQKETITDIQARYTDSEESAQRPGEY